LGSGITFNDYREAREYQEMLLGEGVNSSLVNQHGQYVVVPKEKSNIDMRIIDKAEMGEHSAGEHWSFLGEEKHTIYIEPKASTRTKLHEVGHAIAGHKTAGGRTTGVQIERELDAEIYAWKQQGRELDYRVGSDVLRQCATSKGIWGGDIRSAINEVSRRMEHRGIHVTRENKRDLIDLIYAKTDDPEIEAWKEKLKESL
jgi:hypothetical protein